jgi:amidase/aspartyl-tRNA(Asn)/glutamyl-tRNA(Gln) amidotransferase subunit A
MRQLSTDELVRLGREFGVDVGETEAEALCEQVNGMLASLDAIDDLPVWSSGDDDETGARTWREPEDDPHNALAVECHVPPTGEGLLDGTSVGIKDIVAVAGVPMECGSATMRGYVPRIDATVVDRVRAAGAVITAKTNLDEFAGSARGTTSRDSPIRNPHDPERTAGGSSGGSAVAVANEQVDVALGTDTGGSIRIPASFCGVVGVKPTYGLVPISGIVENTYTQDHVGPLSTTVAESARVLEAMAGKDPTDPGSMAAAGRDDYRVGEFVSAVENAPEVADLAVGVLEEGFGDGVAPAVEERTDAALDAVEDAGASVTPVSVEEFEFGPAIKNILSFTELATHWRAGGAPYRRGGVVDEGYQAALARRANSSSGELSAFYRSKLLAGAQLVDAHDGRHYVRAQAAREPVLEAFTDAFEDVDVLAMPTMPDVAPPLADAADPGFDYARNTRIADVTRLPAVTLPNGDVDGLPVGFQLMGPLFGDDHLLAAAASVEPYLGA